MKTIAMIAAIFGSSLLISNYGAIADQVISEAEMWDRVARTMRPNLAPRVAPGNYDPPAAPPTTSTYTSTTTYRDGTGALTGRSTYRSRTQYR